MVLNNRIWTAVIINSKAKWLEVDSLLECRISNNQLKLDKLVEAYQAHRKLAKEAPAESAEVVEPQVVAFHQTLSEQESKVSETTTTHQAVANKKPHQPLKPLCHNLQEVKAPQTKICRKDLPTWRPNSKDWRRIDINNVFTQTLKSNINNIIN